MIHSMCDRSIENTPFTSTTNTLNIFTIFQFSELCLYEVKSNIHRDTLILSGCRSDSDVVWLRGFLNLDTTLFCVNDQQMSKKVYKTNKTLQSKTPKPKSLRYTLTLDPVWVII